LPREERVGSDNFVPAVGQQRFQYRLSPGKSQTSEAQLDGFEQFAARVILDALKEVSEMFRRAKSTIKQISALVTKVR
jgi:hypothetical protein